MLELEHVSVTYPDGTCAVNDFSLQLEQGEKAALIGSNGAGKTTLMLALEGVLPSTGMIRIDGVELKKETQEEIRRKLGMVFQNPDDQLFMPTIYEDVAFGPRNYGMEETSVRYRVEDRLELLGIGHLRDKTAVKLSGGEKRMAAMATVLAMKPDYILLDEPTAFLDSRARRKLIQILTSLPHAMLISTHDLAFAEEVCGRTVLMREGMLYREGETRALLYDKKVMEEAGVEALQA